MKKVNPILILSFLSIVLSSFCIASSNIYGGINGGVLKIQPRNLDNTSISWGFTPDNKSKTSEINDKLNFKLSDYDVIYNGPKGFKNKALYLTFDEGYEMGYTNEILDVLKEKNVKATFFVTSYYIASSPSIVKRMIDEGHIVANHSKGHYSMPSLTYSRDIFNEEFTDVENKFKELTGENMPKFFRPPMGEYSQKSLAMTKDLGYKTVFWSFAYYDYEPSNQPEEIYAKQHILSHLHDGSIILLHAVSKTNANILGDVIDEARKMGYEFYFLP